PLTLSPSHPLTLSPAHPLTLSPAHPLTRSPAHPLTRSPSHPLTLSPMQPIDEHTDALIARHLAGEASPDEAAALAAWTEASPENERYLTDLQAIWQQSPPLRPAPDRVVDTEAALQRVQNRLRAARPRMVRMATVWRAAAALALALAATYFLWLRTPALPEAHIVATDAPVAETLADGSLVTLGPGSGLSLAAGFNTRERRMRLHGAATFDVQSDSTRPFVVAVQDVEVQVLGTVFRVDDTSLPSRVRVAVAEGRVLVQAGGQTLVLSAGEQAVYDRKARSLLRESPQGRVLRFDATPLREVAQQIEQAYGVSVFLKNKALENCLLTARYNSLPVERVLELVAETFSISLKKTPAGYVLDGAGCE
ncbi:MAG: FecR domain-containing protein, partial [Saprospiraceae bacterium]